jgi:hypothetical protein
MSIKLDTPAEMANYKAGVLERADHHAQGVLSTFCNVFTCVEAFAQPGSISAKEHRGEPKNAFWATLNSRTRIGVRYEHRTKQIEVRRDTLRGPILHSLDDSNASGMNIYEIVKNL